MNKKIKITFWSFLSPLVLPILLFFFMFIVWLNLIFLLIESKNYEVIFFIFILIIFEVVPSIILQLNYLRVDNNKIIEIDTNKSKINIIQNESIFEFSFEDVDRVRMIHSKNYDNVFRGLMPWHTHYYYMICLKNDEEYIVTRLTVRQLEKVLNVRIVYKRVFFPYITRKVLSKTKNN